MHAISAIWPIECYSYSYCVGGSGMCMHADLMLLYLLYLWIMISTKKKSWAELLSISLPSSFRGHPGIAKYCTVWVIFSRYFLIDAFSLACAIWKVSAKVSVTATSWKITSTADCRENWIYAYRILQFSQSQNNHPSSIDLWIALLLSA